MLSQPPYKRKRMMGHRPGPTGSKRERVIDTLKRTAAAREVSGPPRAPSIVQIVPASVSDVCAVNRVLTQICTNAFQRGCGG